MIQEYQVRVMPQVAYNEENIKAFIAKDKGIDARTINHVRTLKRSIDARHRDIFVNLKVRVYINEVPHDDEYIKTEYPDVSHSPRVIVVGAGPGGLFAALKLVELGLRPIVLERGKDVRERKKDLAQISRTHIVDPESNYCFGEGGAGAYSDGKLTHAVRSVVRLRKYSTCSANTAHLQAFLPTLTHILVPTSYQK